MDTVLGCLVTDSIGPGEYTDKFLKNAKETFAYETAVALRSPYQALSLALRRLGLPQGAKVAVSPLAPLYQLEAVEEQGFEAVFIDHDPATGLPLLEQAKMNGCSALVLYEPFGMMPNKEDLVATQLPVIEDMSQSLGATRGETRAGSLGNVVLYGLEQASPVTAGGGALLFAPTRRDAPVIRGISEKLPAELSLTDYNAALGIAKLRDLSGVFARRRELESNFQMELARTRHHTFKQQEDGLSGCVAFPVVLESGMKEVIIHAKRNGIEAAPAFERSIIAREEFPEKACPGARSLAMRCALFPLHERISAKEASIIGKVLATLP